MTTGHKTKAQTGLIFPSANRAHKGPTRTLIGPFRLQASDTAHGPKAASIGHLKPG